jgi:allene oxide cyclase
MHAKRWFAVVAVVTLAMGATVVAQASGATDDNESIRIRVVERALTDVVTDTGESGDSPGDLLTFGNPVFNGANTERVGRDQGSCIRISPEDGTWQCSYTTFLEDGQITVEGPFYDTRDSVLAITGGTGAYRTAHGTQALLHRKDPAEFGFVFRITL